MAAEGVEDVLDELSEDEDEDDDADDDELLLSELVLVSDFAAALLPDEL
ncbi:hypothetical protein [Polyangium spumosum]|nr:hypothetical protein [Polyangium spumosum]